MTQYYKANILIIDDDADTLRLIQMLFQKSGYEPSVASNWDEVEINIQNIEKLKRRFDVVVLDLMMPKMSGFEIYEKLRLKLNPMPQVVILSARSSMEDMVKASDLGAVKYLVKPTKPEKLLEAIRTALSNNPL